MTWWVPSFDSRVLMGLANDTQNTWPVPFLTVKILSSLTTIGAGFAGIVLCFGSPQKPARFYAIWILPFVSLALALVVFNHLFRLPTPQSVLDDNPILAAPVFENASSFFSYIGPGFLAAALGLVLVGLGVRVHAKTGNILPVDFAGEVEPKAQNARRKEMLRFVLLVYGLTIIAPLPMALTLLIATEFGGPLPNDLFLYQRLAVILQTLPVAFVGLWYLRREGSVRELFRLVAPKFLLISVGLPLLAYGVPRATYYCSAEVMHYLNPTDSPGPPPFLELFGLPPVWTLFYFLPALLEEIGWRGYLQRRMVSEFGLKRGLFLVGIAWAVWHLPGNVGDLRMDQAVLSIIIRFASIFAMLVPLGWLFWRTGSVIPVAILHALSNAMLHSSDRADWQAPNWFGIGEWVVLAGLGLWLFKRLPLDPPASEQPATEPKQLPMESSRP